jgi:hypothetical protein
VKRFGLDWKLLGRSDAKVETWQKRILLGKQLHRQCSKDRLISLLSVSRGEGDFLSVYDVFELS